MKSAGVILFSSVLTVLSCLPLSALSADNKEAQLQEIQQEISRLKTIQSKAKQSLKSEQSSLRVIEKEIGKLASSLRAMTRNINESSKRLVELKDEHQSLVVEHQQQLKALLAQIRASYAMGKQERLKLLLNQEDPSRVGRMLVYYDYFHKARYARMQEALATAEKVKALDQAISARIDSLSAEKHALQKRQVALTDKRKQRAQLVAKLESQIDSRDNRLADLVQNERELKQLVEELRRTLSDISGLLDDDKPFREKSGHLPWPVKGRLLAKYGQMRGNAGVPWRGYWIQAKEGDEVHAVSHGRVAFADWLKGFGLLIILDHGDGYMSLYGHNQSLYKDTGEWVGSGEVIARVGNTGGQSRHGLYFEIRKQGKPVNPGKWLASK